MTTAALDLCHREFCNFKEYVLCYNLFLLAKCDLLSYSPLNKGKLLYLSMSADSISNNKKIQIFFFFLKRTWRKTTFIIRPESPLECGQWHTQRENIEEVETKIYSIPK